MARYRDNLKHLEFGEVCKLRGDDLSELGIRDVADRAKAMRMVKEMCRDFANASATAEAEPKDGDEGGDAGGDEDDDAKTNSEMDVDERRNVEDGGDVDEDESTAPSPRKSTPRPKSPQRKSKIRVSVRKRPLNAKEQSRKERDICTSDDISRELTVWEPKVKVDLTRFVEKHAFAFDAVFDESASNDDVYVSEVAPLVEFALSRANATCFAYGQTGSGKTYTMQPLPGRAARDILAAVNRAESADSRADLQLWVSAFEIYGGRVFDLLNGRRKLRVLEDSKSQICVVGLQEYRVDADDTFDRLVEHSTKARCVGSTGANAESSRSHAILQLVLKKPIELKHRNAVAAALASNDAPATEIFGKLSFIDLAGSERGADTTDNDRQTRIEGAEINKSLLALKECIRALDSGALHVPFRGSKLTEVLRDSFLGDSRTVMIANISPAEGSCEHTLNTLRYADRVKELTRGTSSGEPIVALPSSTTASTPTRDPRTMAFAPRVSTPGATRQSLIRSTPPQDGSSAPSRVNGRKSTTSASRRASVSATTLPTFVDSTASMSREEAEQAHDALINVILGEEDSIIAAHRGHIERSMEMVKHEMEFLARVDKPGSAVDAYVDELDAVLAERAADVERLRARVDKFRTLLRQEEELSTLVLSTTAAKC